MPRDGDEAWIVVETTLDAILGEEPSEGIRVFADGDVGSVSARAAVGEAAHLIVPPGAWDVGAFFDAVDRDICGAYVTTEVEAGPAETVRVALALRYEPCAADTANR